MIKIENLLVMAYLFETIIKYKNFDFGGIVWVEEVGDHRTNAAVEKQNLLDRINWKRIEKNFWFSENIRDSVPSLKKRRNFFHSHF